MAEAVSVHLKTAVHTELRWHRNISVYTCADLRVWSHTQRVYDISKKVLFYLTM